MCPSSSSRFSKQSLREVLRQCLGLTSEISITPTSTGKFNDSFFIDGTQLERPLVVRVAPEENRRRMLFYEHRMMHQEPRLHRLLRENTAAPVPEVLHFEERNPILRRDFIVMERMPGEPLSTASEATLTELGATLRQVHDTLRATPSSYGYLGEHQPMTPQKTWQESFRIMWNALLTDILNCEGAEPREIEQWRARFENHSDTFKHYDRPASLLHMDVWAENILCDSSGRLTGLIDWDRALWGDPEIEYAVLDYCGISTPSFWRGYGKPRPSDHDAQIRRLFYLLYEVLKYIVIRIARQANRRGAEQYRSMAINLFDQL